MKESSSIHGSAAAAALIAAMVAGGCASVPGRSGSHIVFHGRLLACVPEEQARMISTSRTSAQPDAWRVERVGPTLPSDNRASGARAWLVLSPPRSATHRIEREHPWDLAHQAADAQGQAAGRLLGDLQTRAGGSPTLLAVEPDMFHPDPRGPEKLDDSKKLDAYTSRTEGQTLTLCDRESLHWPRRQQLGWHLSDEFSELRSARQYVATNFPPRTPADRIRIAILDTGYDEDHVANPPGLNKRESRDFTQDPLNPSVGAVDPFQDGPFHAPGHGCGCLGILAGGRVSHPESGFDEAIGGAPSAEVICLRISDSVVHLLPSTMATAIRYAVAQGCDVISLSHGGLPSRMLADAVNEAYERGTAIFAASGDFFVTPLFGWSTPRFTVYPAAFSRVASVCGVTADGQTYGKAHSWMTLLTFRKWSSWMMRGNYGPPSAMQEAIAAYTPNVLWPRHSKEFPSNLADRDGGGTSAATPQVAAAAALWLQAHRHDPALTDKWRNWEKAESVYLALFDSAAKRTAEGADTMQYFGNGLLKARRALDLGVPRDMQKRPEASVGLGWLGLLTSITPAVRSASGTRSAGDAGLHLQMFQTEIAQLVQGSESLQRVVETLNIDIYATAPPERTALLGFAQALRAEPRASRYLKTVLKTIERDLSAAPPAK
jgi:hypothetical protein